MAFSTKIKLTNQHVEQTQNSSLALSGKTQVATVGDLRYQTHPNFTGDTQVVDKRYVDLQASGATGSTVYKLASPASVCVGGIDVGTILTGKTSNEILKEILVPTLNPVLTNPSSSISLNPSGTFEVGCSISTLCVTTILNQGCINPQYTTTCDKRSNGACCYKYNGVGVTGNYACSALSVTKCAVPYVVSAGTQTWCSCITYCAGVQPKNSAGGNYDSPLSAGDTTQQTTSITGIYPYFWGKCTCPGAAGANRPTATSTMVSGGTKIVADSSGTLQINFNSIDNDYLWFAYPNTNAVKTCWYVSALNNGVIGGSVTPGGNLFPAPDAISVTTICWAGQTYKVYISNYQSSALTTMCLS